MRLLHKYTWTPLNLSYLRCIEHKLLLIVTIFDVLEIIVKSGIRDYSTQFALVCYVGSIYPNYFYYGIMARSYSQGTFTALTKVH